MALAYFPRTAQPVFRQDRAVTAGQFRVGKIYLFRRNGRLQFLQLVCEFINFTTGARRLVFRSLPDADRPFNALFEVSMTHDDAMRQLVHSGGVA